MDIRKEEIIRSFSGVYCCQNDEFLTLESDLMELSYLCGYSKEEIEEMCQDGLIHLVEERSRDIFLREIKEQMKESDDIECLVPIRKKNGTIRWLLNRAKKMKTEEGKEYLCGILVDASASKGRFDKEKETVDVLWQQAKRDSLTEIYNAYTSRKMAEEYLHTYGKEESCALLIIDLDDFKQINDQYGHMFGDAVLKQTAHSISKLFRSNDIVGRIGGDEFMVLMKDITDREIVQKRCRQINEMLKQIFEVQLKDYAPSCSIGVSFSPEHGNSYFSLFCCADQALYRAKEQGRQQFVFFDEKDCGLVRGKNGIQYANYDMNVLRSYLE